MAKKTWFLLAFALSSASLARAAEGDAKAGAAPSPLFKDPVIGLEMVFVQGGCYRMGDASGIGRVFAVDLGPAEEPVHEVCVDGFYIGKYEVTEGQWKTIMGSAAPWDRLRGKDDQPVESVGWTDVQEFIKRLNAKSGGGKFRLPTEAEWEYAARSGGRDERYSGGNDLDSVSWYAENSQLPNGDRARHPVGTKAPNGLGIHDMSGNVWEMTNDWFALNYYSVSPRDNPTGPSSGKLRVKRGGCSSGSAVNSRTTMRDAFTGPEDGLGFRLVVRTP